MVIAETENYAGAEATTAFTIAKKAVAAIVSVESKTYDRNNTATVSASVGESDLVPAIASRFLT